MLAIWEPILFTDWARPGAAVLGRLRDSRVRQFWDPQHLFAEKLERALQANSSASAAEDSGNDEPLWDFVAVFPPQARWQDSLPAPIFAGGPVVHMTGRLEKLLGGLTSEANVGLIFHSSNLGDLPWHPQPYKIFSPNQDFCLPFAFKLTWGWS